MYCMTTFLWSQTNNRKTLSHQRTDWRQHGTPVRMSPIKAIGSFDREMLACLVRTLLVREEP
jgi:hypothetical protein